MRVRRWRGGSKTHLAPFGKTINGGARRRRRGFLGSTTAFTALSYFTQLPAGAARSPPISLGAENGAVHLLLHPASQLLSLLQCLLHAFLPVTVPAAGFIVLTMPCLYTTVFGNL